MLADIAGYSALMERHESSTFERVKTLREELVNPIVTRYGGRIIKTTGDGFLAEFSSGTAAVLCGIELQRRNQAREASNPEGERLHLRMGINLGDVIFDGDDVSGDGVNVAARLEPLAPRDGICVSGAVRDQLREDLEVVFEDLGEQILKNIARPIRAYRIDLANAVVPKSVLLPRLRRKWLIAAVASIALLSVGGLRYCHPGTSATKGGNFAGIRITSALVIGNGKYATHSALANPGNDAIAIATALKLRGAPVTVRLDLRGDDLAREIEEFKAQDDGGGVKVFFYAGHGWNVNGKNFIFPIDAPGRDELLAGNEIGRVFPVENIYQSIAGKMIVLLDTHGDPVSVPDNVVLTFSGSPRTHSQDAYELPDGTMSRNSPYAASIIEMLSGSDENLPTAFLRLAQRVGQKTSGQQIPWVSGSIVGASSWGSDPVRH